MCQTVLLSKIAFPIAYAQDDLLSSFYDVLS